MSRLRNNLAILSVIGLFAISQLPLIFSNRHAFWDEAVYLAIGKYIYSSGASGLWEPIRPLGLPLVLGLVWKLHLPYLLFSGLVKSLFSAGTIFLTYLLSKKLFGMKAALLAALLLATSPLFFYYSALVLTEIPSVFFILAAAYFFSERKFLLCGAAAALSMLFKFTNGLLIVAVAASLVALHLLERGKFRHLLSSIAKVAGSFAAVSVPFLVFNALFYRSYAGDAFGAALRPFALAAWHQSNPAKAIANPFYNYAFYVVQLLLQHFALILAGVALFIFWKKKWYLDAGKNLLASVLFIYFAYFSYIPNKDERFLLTFLPLACIFAAAAFFETFDHFKQKSRLPRLRQFALVSLVALLILSFAVVSYVDSRSYGWRAFSQPATTELYTSISNLGIEGAVMTSDPAFAVYNDNLFLPFYDSSSGAPQELKPSWSMKTVPFEAVIYSPQTLYCPPFDIGCYEAREKLHAQINSSYKLLFNGTYFDGTIDYYIYVNESLYKRK